MKNIIYNIKKQSEMSDETIDLLTKQLTPCRFPKRYLLIREGVYHKLFHRKRNHTVVLAGRRKRGYDFFFV